MRIHYEDNVSLSAAASEVFLYADDFSQLGSHMNKSSWMMMGQSMKTVLDDEKGQAVGSHVRMQGRIMGVDLVLEEVVTEREPPYRKAWETIGKPRLLVIGPYRLGFDITDKEKGSAKFRVFIDYDLPTEWPSRWLGMLLGKIYAKWCVRRMVNDAREHFVADFAHMMALP